ncbi:MAG: ribosome assembly cofactor RimP [Spirochaetes bacterium]|nr:ribosome assembly cofactor RimP [Spirochaetota bacterium]
MYADRFEQAARAEIEPAISAMGYALVELSVGRRKGVSHVVVVLHRPGGVGVDDCAGVTRAIQPRLELVEGLENVSLEVSSPGIERTLKDPSEYGIFRGRGVQVLPAEGSEWIGGVIEAYRDGTLVLRTPEGMREFPPGAVRRGRLDYRLDPKDALGPGPAADRTNG